MDADRLAEFLARGREQPGVEFKGSFPRTDKLFFAKVTRAVLGMANHRDGGYVVVGVEDVNGTLEAKGLDPAALTTWRYDHVADGIAVYADPSVEFDLAVVRHDDKDFVVIRVEEFSTVPVLCRKTYTTREQGEVTLREGACYIRPRRKPETIEVSTYADLRDLIDLATEKGVRVFVERAHAAGMQVGGQPKVAHKSRFAQQRGDFK
jgi:predicted HTH transcriptional regulator